MADLSDNDQPVEQPETSEEPKVEQQEELTPEEQALANPQEEPEAPKDPANPEEEPAPQEPETSRRKAKRLEKLEGLVERLRGPQQQPQRKTPGIDYSKLIEAEPEVYQQLEKESQSYGQAQYEAGLQQANTIQFHTNLRIDAPRIESKYPIFDTSSPEFNPGVASAINQWYLASAGFVPGDRSRGIPDRIQNPELSYSDFVEGIMELADGVAGVKAVKTTQNIARQAANTGLRPDGSSAKPLNLNKAPQDMNEAELKAAINASMPRDNRGRFTS